MEKQEKKKKKLFDRRWKDKDSFWTSETKHCDKCRL